MTHTTTATGNDLRPQTDRSFNLAVIGGDGIGPEVISEGLKVLNAVAGPSVFIPTTYDLGASRWSAFRTVTLPLSKTGILGGAVLITLPMFGDYYTPNIVSSSPTTSMIGNQIDLYFHGGPQPTIGAALTIVLAAFLTILMLYYMWSIHRAQREVGAVGAL